MRQAKPSLTDSLRTSRPRIHGGGDESWGLAWAALAWLEHVLEPGMTTLETGAGMSTILFAAAGTKHEAITPVAAEKQRIYAECERRGIPTSGVTFRIGPSHEILPALEPRTLDLVLIDGAHGFPYPILDWWFLGPRLRTGGLMVIDDSYMPTVGALVDFLQTRGGWDIVAKPGYRTVVVRKLGADLPPYEWRGERIGGGVSFRYLPPLRRARAAVQHRLLESPLGRWAARVVYRRLA